MSQKQSSFYPSILQGWGIVGIFLIVSIFVSIVTSGFEGVLDKGLILFITYLFAMGIPLGIIYSVRKKKTGITSFNFKLDYLVIVPVLFFVTLGLQLGLIGPITDLIPMPEEFVTFFKELMGDKDIYNFLTVVIAAPILEELIFRGLILDGFLKRYSPTKAILFSSMFFGIIHFNPWQFVAAMILGCFIGWVYLKTKSVSYGIIIHMINNGCAFAIMMFISEDQMNLTGPELYGGSTNYVIIIIGSLLVTGVGLYYLSKYFKETVPPITWKEDAIDDFDSEIGNTTTVE
ncbi:CPBP family intramembrane metalloprotease [Flammeovirga pectinis]|uniref:CPBP family intramembrane metalloprotease n=1 Tax=Flammeovirga pectinis TaxID=2494373 RepID=A0A3S9NY36_9BACT|nr:type II CAAX endopeptidase family protein [Flammeovirga pectinis]AZQ60880.1 CPBP family intramembrane metalloprotease [Flammeovirga pectinis]